MEKHVLSKSTFIRGVQCLKSLYLNKKRPFLRDRIPKERLIVFKRGHQVGELAQQLFPGGENMSPGHPAAFKKALANTQEKINEGYPVIYEAAFQSGQVLIFLDILVQTDNGWHAYEVKSSGGISDTYLMDAALQYHVIKGSGLDLSGISLIHIDKEYVLEAELEPRKLFRIVDVTQEAQNRQDYVEDQIKKEKEALLLESSPKIEVGPHCREPYDCDFIGHCWKKVVMPEIMPLAEQLSSAGKINIQESKAYAILKILSIRPAIPRYKGIHPYQTIAVGYAIADTKGDNIRAEIFPHISNPETKLIPALEKELDGIDTIFCFGESYILNRILPEKDVIDLTEYIDDKSDFYTRMKDQSELKRLHLIFNAGSDNAVPEYASDSVAGHYYLEEFEDETVISKLKAYLGVWTDSLAGFIKLIT